MHLPLYGMETAESCPIFKWDEHSWYGVERLPDEIKLQGTNRRNISWEYHFIISLRVVGINSKHGTSHFEWHAVPGGITISMRGKNDDLV